MIRRTELMGRIRQALRLSRIVALLGPRQCGKTTLAQALVPGDSPRYFDLEDPEQAARLEAPMTALRPLRGCVVIDEIQRRQDLFPILRVLADRRPLPARFLILGSASPSLMRAASESLAGRIETIHMQGFTLTEAGPRSYERHWLRGGFPLSFLARTAEDSYQWRRGFIRTVVERDLPALGMRLPAESMLRFWRMLAHVHGQVWHAADPARSLGLSETSVRRYLDVLSDLFLMRQLHPWHANLGKRQVKSPKIFFRDSGLLHQLLGIRTSEGLHAHPKLGASWEGYAAEEVIRLTDPDEACFWATHNGAELDLLLVKDGVLQGVECKYADAPRMTPSMRIAMHDLKLHRLTVIYPGARPYELAPRVQVVPLGWVLSRGAEWFRGGVQSTP